MDRHQLAETRLKDLFRAVDRAIYLFGRADVEGVVQALDMAAHEIKLVQRDLVEVLRQGGYTWQQVGDVLGISRQAAHERFSIAMND